MGPNEYLRPMQGAIEMKSIENGLGQLGPPEDKAEWLRKKANWIRLSAMTMTHHSKLGHTGGDLSSADILATLYLGQVLRVDPKIGRAHV